MKKLFYLFAALLISQQVLAVDKTWTGASNTNWANAGNWSPAGIPATGDNIIINNVSNDPIIQNGTTVNVINISLNTGASLTVNSGGTLNVSQFTVTGIYLDAAALTNNGTINLTSNGDNVSEITLLSGSTVINSGTISLNSGYGITNSAGAIFTNNACGKVILADASNNDFRNSGTVTNDGLIQIFWWLHNSGTITNNGVLKYETLNTTGGGTMTNNRIIIDDDDTPIFQLGASNNATVNGIYTNSNATATAGTYDQGTNTFTPGPLLSGGLLTLYVKITPNGGACTYVVPFLYTNNIPLPVITANPVSKTACPGSAVSFSITATGAQSYRWQVSTDGGNTWANVPNSTPYSNITSATLNISSATGLNNYRYRCNATNLGGTVSSNAATLTVSGPVATPTGTITWNGSVSTDWATACNWSPASVPGSGNSVVIPDAANDPVIGSGVTVLYVDIQDNAQLTVSSGASLTTTAGVDYGINLRNGSTFTNNGTTVIQGSTNIVGFNTEYVSTLNNNGTLTIGADEVAFLAYNNGSLTVNNAVNATITINGNIGGFQTFDAATLQLTNSGSIIYNGPYRVFEGVKGSVNNNGLIHATGGMGTLFYNSFTLTNAACAQFILAAGSLFTGNDNLLTNNGYFNVGGEMANASDFTNNGVLKYGTLNQAARPIINTAASSVIVTNSVPIFTYGVSGSSYNGTVNGIFTDPAATLSAGTYTQATNTFVPSGLPSGSQTLYAKITPSGGGCSYVVPFTYTVTNASPTITAAAPIIRQQSTAGSIATIATVNDTETPAGSLTVTAVTTPNDITVTNITNSAGTITATIAANCFAALGANTVVLRVTDANGGTATANFTVNVTENTPPTLTYNDAFLSPGAGGSILPAIGPTDNEGAVVYLQGVSPSSSPATITVNSVTGIVTVPNTIPAGIYTITVVATDACTTDVVVPIRLSVQSTDYTITTTGGNVVITDVTGAGETLTVSENGGNLRFDVTGKTYSIDGGPTTSFTTPADVPLSGKTSITINTASGNDIINIGAFTTSLPSLTVNGGIGDDQINFIGDIAFATNAHLDLDLQNDDAGNPGIDAVTFAANANVVLSGTGTATVKVSKNVTVNAGASLVTAEGNLTIEANQQTPQPTGGNFIGILVTGTDAKLQVTGSGLLTLKGTGGDIGNFTYGVHIINGGKIYGGTNTLQIEGTGGRSSGDLNMGVRVSGNSTVLSTTGGDIRINGAGGGTSSTGNLFAGFQITTGALISSGGAGQVEITGRGSLNTASGNIPGVSLNAGTISTAGGNITINGYGGGSGTSENCFGIAFQGTTLSPAGMGHIILYGEGGPGSGGNNVGIYLSGLLSSNGGDIRLTGKEGSHTTSSGIYIRNTLATGEDGELNTLAYGGNVTLTTNSLLTHGESFANIHSSNSLTIVPRTPGVGVSFTTGSDIAAGPIIISDTELDNLIAGTINIGDNTTGTINVNTAISHASGNINLRTGGTLNLNSSYDVGSGNLTVNAAGGINPTTTGVDLSGSSISFATNNNLNIVINGTTANTNYRQLNVSGVINLTGLNLVLSGSHTPVAGQTFTIVNNDGSDLIAGTFNGLAQGATIANFLGSSLSATISYTGGDGNDAVITVDCPTFAAPTASVTAQPTCTTPTGTIVVTAPTGANIQYSVDGTNYQASATFGALAPNITYSVTAKNTTTGCVSDALSLVVNAVPNAPATPTASVTVQPTCTTPTGTIVVTAPTGANIHYSIDGTNYQASATFSGLAPNTTYSVTAKNTTTGCVSDALSLVVSAIPGNPATPTALVTAQPTCTTPTGTIVVTAPTGGTIQYSIDGTNYQASATFSGLAPNITYSVTTKNTTTGCISSPLSLTVNAVPNAPAIPTASVTVQPTCTIPTGTIVVTAPTGTDIQYSIDGTNYQASATFSGLAPNTTYSVTAKNTTTGCISQALSLAVNALPSNPATPTASVMAQPTCTTPTGTIVVTAPIGADIQYSVDGTNYQASATFSALAPNITYSVTAKNTTTGCVSDALSLIVNAIPGNPATPTASVTAQPTCTTPTGTIVVTAPTGADIQYSIDGTNYQASATFSALAPNITYSVTAKNTTTGCVSDALSLIVNAIPGNPATPTASVTAQPTCTTPTGTIVVTAPIGADIQYSVDGTNYQASATFSALAPNITYSVKAKNTTTGCVSDALSLIVNAIPGNPATPTASVTAQPTCTTPTGTIVVTAPTGADIQYSVNGTNYQASGTFSGLAPNPYSVTAKNTATGCISDALSLTVNTVPNAPATPTASVTAQPTCTTPTGTIEVTAPTGGTIQYSIDGTNYQASGTFSALAPNTTYSVTAKNTTTGCISSPLSLTVSAVPNAPATPTASVTAQPICTTPTGTIVVTAPTGGTIQYSIDGTNYQASATFSGLIPNTTYSVKAKNTTTGCVSDALSLAVNAVPANPVTPTASVTAQPTCTTPTGTIEVTAPTGTDIQYSIDGTNYQASAIFSGLTPGTTYLVTAKNTTTGCISQALSLAVNALPSNPATPTASVTAQPTCTTPTGTIVVTAPTGADIQYSVNGTNYQASATFSGLASNTTYSVTAKNTTTGCVSDALSLIVNAIPGNPATPTASVTVQPTCTTPTGTIEVTAPTGGNIQYSIGGAYLNSGTFSGLTPGTTYLVIAKNTTTGCISQALSLIVNAIPGNPATPTASVTAQPTCTTPTGTIVVTAPTGTDIQYSVNGTNYQVSATFSGLASNTTYSVTAKNTTTGCVSDALSLVVNAVPNAPAIPTASVTVQPTCTTPTGTIVVTAPTGGTIQYSINGTNYQASGTFSGLAPNPYSVTAKNTATGCISDALSLTVNTVPNAPATPTASVTAQPTCTTLTGTIEVTAPTGGTIQYSIDGMNYQASASFSGLTPGTTYSVTAKNTTTGCVSSPLSLIVNVAPTTNDIAVSFSGPNPVCQGSPSALLPNTGGTWTSNDLTKATVTADGQITALQAGTVTFTFTTLQGCTAVSPALTIKPTPSSALTASQTEVCPNTQVTLDAHCSIPTATVNWRPGAPTVIPDAANIAYVYRARCESEGCIGNESSVEVRTHRILVDMKDLDVGTLPLPIARAVKDNMAPTNVINAPVFPRRWTFIATGCNASESAVFRLLGPVSFQTVDNEGMYAMFGNDGGGFYSLDHPNYGNGGSFPNGTYTLTVDLRSSDGVGGPFPKNRVAAGSLLATRSLQFTVQNPVARMGISPEPFAAGSEGMVQVIPNPVVNTMRLHVSDSRGESVNIELLDTWGRNLLQGHFVALTDEHQEEFDLSHLSNGLYFLRVKTGNKQTVLKVIKVQ